MGNGCKGVGRHYKHSRLILGKDRVDSKGLEGNGPPHFSAFPPPVVKVGLTNEKAYTEIASIEVADTQTYAHPVLAGNRLFVRDQDSLTLWLIQ